MDGLTDRRMSAVYRRSWYRWIVKIVKSVEFIRGHLGGEVNGNVSHYSVKLSLQKVWRGL